MDYSGSTELWQHQWGLIHDPENMLFAWAQDEREGEYGVFGVTWLGNILWGLAPDDQERQVENDLTLFDHVYQNFDNYLNESTSKNVDIKIEKYKEWSVRQESKSGIARKVFEGVKDERSTFSLWNKGIYLEEYTLERKRYKLCIHSKIQDINIDTKVRLKTPDELRYCKYLKLGYTDNYGLIVFYDNDGKMSMVIQVFGGNTIKETTTQWGNYLGLLLTEKQPVEDKSKSFEDLVKPATIHNTEELNEIWSGESQEESSILSNYEKKLTDIAWRSQYGYFCGRSILDCFNKVGGNCGFNCGSNCYNCCVGVAGLDQSDPLRIIYTRDDIGILPTITPDGEKDIVTNFNNLLEEIKNSLDANQALIAGVFKMCKFNIEGNRHNNATHHWIVVVGMKIDGNTGTLYYHDPGALDKRGELQELTIDIVNMKISGTSKYNYDMYLDEDKALYLLTEIKVKQKYHIIKK